MPIKRYSVLEGLTERRLDVSQLWTVSSLDDRMDKEQVESEAEKEMYSWVSSAYRWNEMGESLNIQLMGEV